MILVKPKNLQNAKRLKFKQEVVRSWARTEGKSPSAPRAQPEGAGTAYSRKRKLRSNTV